MSASYEIQVTLTSNSEAIEDDLELELDKGHTIQDILDYLVQMNLLKIPRSDIVFKKDGNTIPMNMDLENIKNAR